MTMEQRDDIFDFGMMNAEDSLIDEVNPDWCDFADGGDELFWRCGCETDFVHPESLSVCPICGREWSRTANSEISGKLCTFCRIAVD